MVNEVNKCIWSEGEQRAYRIRANRTPLLIRKPGYTFLWHTLVRFCEKLSKIAIFFGRFISKLTNVHNKKIIYFNRKPAFYLGGFGMQFASKGREVGIYCM